ncbi:MAG: DUF2752 domain-containing protein, partial [Bacteroidota bacterium]
LLILGIGWLIHLFIHDPQESDAFISCPIYSVSGYECPGCGSQRAIHDVMHFRLVDAFKHNAMVLLMLPYIFFGFIYQYLNITEVKKIWIRKNMYGGKIMLLIIAAVLVFGILRNF